MSIILDTRERDLIPLFQNLSTAEPLIKALPVGDCWIGLSAEDTASSPPGGLVIERKTVADLEASLTDGRYREQRTRLLAFCAEHKARALYCIEGSLDRLGGKKTQQELWCILNRLMLRYGVFVAQTESLQETAKYIQTLASQLTQDPSVFQGTTLSYSDVTSFTKKGNKEDPTQFALAVLQQCPGVSAAAAKAILGVYKTLPTVFATPVEELQKVQVGSRKLGPVVAKRLLSLFNSSLEKS